MHRQLIDALLTYLAARDEHARVLRLLDPARTRDEQAATETALAELYAVADTLDATVVATCPPPGLEL